MNLTRRLLALSLAISMAAPLPLQAAQYAPIGTLDVADAEQALDAGQGAQLRERIAQGLSRPDVAAQLVRLGVDPASARLRAQALGNADAERLAAALDSAPAGGDPLGLVLFVFLAVLVCDILGFTRILPFTRPLR